MAVRAASCPRGWFPPATFQMRLRALRAIYYIASASPRGEFNSGYFYVTIHDNVAHPALWTSPRVKWSSEKEERLEWSDIEVDDKRAHKGLKSIVVKVWFSTQSHDDESQTEILETTWGMHFSGLWCLGVHAPSYGRLPTNSVILHMSGSYFSSASHIRDGNRQDTFIPRYLHIGSPEDSQAVKSYSVQLLARLHRLQRALKQQDGLNTRLTRDLRNKGIDWQNSHLEKSSDVKQQKNSVNNSSTTLPSLRQAVFSKRVKLASTRIAENDLAAEHERLRLRIALLRKECDRRKNNINDMTQERQGIAQEVEEMTMHQMKCYHDLAKEKTAFYDWVAQFKTDTLAYDVWMSALKNQRLSLIGGLDCIFPIGDLGSKRPTMRWITLPPANELRDSTKNEVLASVAIGWVAQACFVVSDILDIPLRYPITLLGTNTTIMDEVRGPQDMVDGKHSNCTHDHCVFPLYLKSMSSSDWSRYEYGIYLLSKNLAQLRWHCGLVTTDLRPILHNLDGLFNIGRDVVVPTGPRALDDLPSVYLQPPSHSIGQQNVIVMKNGKAIRPAKNVATSSSESSRRSSLLDAKNKSLESVLTPKEEDDDDEEDQDLPTERNSKNVDESRFPESPVSSDVSPVQKQSQPQSEEEEDEKREATKCPAGSEDSSAGHHINDLTPDQSPGESGEGRTQSNSSSFWNDVASRTSALSSKRTAFQRPRSNY